MGHDPWANRMKQVSDVTWGDILGYLRTHYPALARGWFDQLRGGDLQRGQLSIVAANHPQLIYLREHCVRPFVEAAQAATGRLVSVVFVNCQPSLNGEEAPGGPEGDMLSFERESSLLQLSPDHHFDGFVMGPCNRLALGTCRAVCDELGAAYNPTYIHGGVGVGKTHLLHAVCHHVLEESPGTRVCYITCESFVNHLLEAKQAGAVNRFRDRYRRLDLLAIDDIQFLGSHEESQEEFFHTFNALHEAHKQIIISADRPPAMIRSLQERLVSRFNWGLVARMDPPGLETRQAVLCQKARGRRIQLPKDVVALIAGRADLNARELEGVLAKLQGLAASRGRSIDQAMAREVLDAPEAIAARSPIHLEDILRDVMGHYGVKRTALTGPSRSRSIALPRQICMYLARRFTVHSLEDIGRYFGRRDHTTVIHANRQIAKRRKADPSIGAAVEQLEAGLRRRSGTTSPNQSLTRPK